MSYTWGRGKGHRITGLGGIIRSPTAGSERGCCSMQPSGNQCTHADRLDSSCDGTTYMGSDGTCHQNKTTIQFDMVKFRSLRELDGTEGEVRLVDGNPFDS